MPEKQPGVAAPPSFRIRQALPADCPLVYTMITELAAFEQLAHQVSGTEEDLRQSLFSGQAHAEVALLEVEGAPAGFVLFFHNYSTFLCRNGLYIEDLYVREAFRGRGYGSALIRHVCALARDRQCGRVEWWCLDQNTPAIHFYRRLGAEPMTDWTVWRLNTQGILRLSEG
jgi:GNAT superfamily N-acetyltransferase